MTTNKKQTTQRVNPKKETNKNRVNLSGCKKNTKAKVKEPIGLTQNDNRVNLIGSNNEVNKFEGLTQNNDKVNHMGLTQEKEYPGWIDYYHYWKTILPTFTDEKKLILIKQFTKVFHVKELKEIKDGKLIYISAFDKTRAISLKRMYCILQTRAIGSPTKEELHTITDWDKYYADKKVEYEKLKQAKKLKKKQKMKK